MHKKNFSIIFLAVRSAPSLPNESFDNSQNTKKNNKKKTKNDKKKITRKDISAPCKFVHLIHGGPNDYIEKFLLSAGITSKHLENEHTRNHINIFLKENDVENKLGRQNSVEKNVMNIDKAVRLSQRPLPPIPSVESAAAQTSVKPPVPVVQDEDVASGPPPPTPPMFVQVYHQVLIILLEF